MRTKENGREKNYKMAINSKLKQGLKAARRRSKATASRPSGAYKWHGHMINTVAMAFGVRQLETELE